MKKIGAFIILTILSICFTISGKADVIILKDGSSINVYNIEKGAGSVFYTLSPDADSPLKKIPLSEVFAVKVGEGDMQLIENSANEPQTPAKSTAPQSDSAKSGAAASNNSALIRQYNAPDVVYNSQEKDKPAKDVIAIWGVTPTSVLSTDDIEIRFETGLWSEGKWIPTTQLAKKKNMCWVNNMETKIIVYNKTRSPLYIDLSQTIRNSPTIGYRQFYDGTVTTKGNSSSTSVGLGLGLLGIGSSSGNSQTLTEGNPSVLVVFPESEIALPRESYISDYDKKIYERYERYSYFKGPAAFAAKIGDLKQYQSVFYDYNDSPEKINYYLTYSAAPDFSSTSRINFTLYIRQLIGIPVCWNSWSGKFQDNLNYLSPLTDNSIMSTFKLTQ